ncbi:hypothetical protein PHJA_001692000 [Phtheirospermum japonicum]|uniref:Btz domain-containing protein n=1 Tax=Phtheirospermum japonicum TaxID=374723 RepID=A0A830C423_9LAMI|nr:hypothetical protein PHJA_001692000 [Phtheirospermum japonicum]
MAEGEIDYESDPEEAKLSLKLRRREASDDEEEEDRREKPPRRIDDSDGESEGAAGEYEDELEEEEEYDLDEEYVEEEIEEVVAMERVESGKEGAVAVAEEENKGVDNETAEVDDENINGAEGQHEEETKDVEPFAVPTAGAFYMHDDRFRDSAGGRHRRTLGGRKLWESKDDRKWGHDKFEELTMHERHFEEPRRGSRVRNRGRGRNRGTERIYAQVNRPEEYSNNNTQSNSNQSNAPKSVRGRGPRRSGKSVEKHSYVNSGSTYEPVSNTKSDMTLPRKQVASSLNIASPPFYPTGSSAKDNTVPLKRDVQAGTINRNSQQSVMDEKSHTAQSTATVRGKNIVDSISVENLYYDDSHSGKPSNSMQVPLSQLRGQERVLTSAQMAYQPVVSKNQFNRGPPSQTHNVQRNPGQSHVQSSVPQGTQRLPSGPQTSKGAGAVNAIESGEVESASESKTAVVAAKGKGSMQGSGKGPFLYGGAQVMGSGRGDQNFPTFLPVMQFGRQHPGGIGVPAVGMAFPGYVAQPQLGLGSSEMTWLPVLAGAAGALGASYCPSYISMDGSYNARPSGPTSSIAAASSKESNAAKVGNDGKPAQRPDLANDDFGQRQKNPRRQVGSIMQLTLLLLDALYLSLHGLICRYTEMKFDQ